MVVPHRPRWGSSQFWPNQNCAPSHGHRCRRSSRLSLVAQTSSPTALLLYGAVAICLEPHEAVSITVADGDPSVRREHRQVTDEPSWFDGPLFAVVEEVFDEHSIEACSLTPRGEGVGGTGQL